MELTALQWYILRLLSEAGEENIPTMVNTLQAEAVIADKAKLLSEVNSALEGLLKLRLISYAYYQEEPVPDWRILSDNEVQKFSPISNCLGWNEADGFWSWREERFGKERVLVIISEQAKELIRAR